MHNRHSLRYMLERLKRLSAIKSHDLQKMKGAREHNNNFGKVPQESFPRPSGPTGSLCEYNGHLLLQMVESAVFDNSVPFGTMIRVSHAVFCVKRTQHSPLSALHAKNRVRNA